MKIANVQPLKSYCLGLWKGGRPGIELNTERAVANNCPVFRSAITARAVV